MLLLLILILGFGATTFLSAWNNSSAKAMQEQRTRLALQKAKEAVIGYAAVHKTKPGTLICPEQLSPSAPIEGQAGSNCTGANNVLGRLPWRTLKIDNLVDEWGEPLWYVVSSGFGSQSTITNTTTGNITVDGTLNAAVALIIAPGPPLPNQTRTQPSPTNPPQAVNYLDQSNAGLLYNSFVTRGPQTTYNDRIIIITKAELFKVVDKRILGEMRGTLTANGVLQYYNDNANTFPPNGTPLSTLPFDTDTKNYLNPWFSLISYTYTAPTPPKLSLGGEILLVKP